MIKELPAREKSAKRQLLCSTYLSLFSVLEDFSFPGKNVLKETRMTESNLENSNSRLVNNGPFNNHFFIFSLEQQKAFEKRVVEKGSLEGPHSLFTHFLSIL